MTPALDLTEHIRQSNLIEDVHGQDAIDDSLEAWAYLTAQPAITVDVVLETHRLVMQRLWPQIAGKLRTVGVTVGGRTCPDHRHVPQMLDTWVDHMARWDNLDPVTMHIDFEHIHPFRDGNGRTGRLLLWRHQIQARHDPTVIKYVERFGYYDWFDNGSGFTAAEVRAMFGRRSSTKWAGMA